MINKKCVYLTGGCSGIGLGLAQFYPHAGNDLVLPASNQLKLDVAVRGCRDVAVNTRQVIAGESVDIMAFTALPAKMDRPSLLRFV